MPTRFVFQFWSPYTTCPSERRFGATATTLVDSLRMLRPSSSVRRAPLPSAPRLPETCACWGKTMMKFEPIDSICCLEIVLARRPPER